MAQPYVGRFAPSPTGPLHFGSLVAAMASFLEARSHQGKWLLRIDDVDETRCIPQAEAKILHSLESFGLHWDGEIARQTQNKPIYAEYLNRLIEQHKIYACECSRKQIASESSLVGKEGPIYPKTCIEKQLTDKHGTALRLVSDERVITFNDKVYGPLQQILSREIGDFIVRRADGYTAYQFAVVIDDHITGVNHIVRGADLLWSTPRQIHIHCLLHLPCPAYAHIPLVFTTDGKKLSKSDSAFPLDNNKPIPAIHEAWRFLGQHNSEELPNRIDDFWPWAIKNWDITKLRNNLEQSNE